MKKLLPLFILLALSFSELSGQNYQQSAGLRIGAAGGITYRRMFSPDMSAEVMLAGQNHGSVLALLVEKHVPAVVFDNINMTFIYGAGVHAGHARYKLYDSDLFDTDDDWEYRNSFQLGVDGFASLEYLLPRYPVSFSIECKPYFEFFEADYNGLHLPVMAFGARYMF